MAGFFDLNIQVTKHFSSQWEGLVAQLLVHQYSSIALNLTFQDKLPNDFYNQYPSTDNTDKLKIYKRVTLVLTSHIQHSGISGNNSSLNKAPHTSPDIVAVEPTTEKAFQLACQSLDIQIISLGMTDKIPFYLKRQLVHLAIGRGIFFELKYSDLLTADTTQKRNVLANWMNLLSVTKGKNIILSSGILLEHQGKKDNSSVGLALKLRHPEELLNILVELQQQESSKYIQNILKKNPLNLLYQAATKKYTFKGILAIEPKCLVNIKNANLPPHKKIKLANNTEESKEERMEERDHFAMDFISFEK